MERKGCYNSCMDCSTPVARKATLRCRKCSAIAMRKNKDIDTPEYRRNWSMKKKYGLEPEDFEVYWIACRGKCWICDVAMKYPTKTRGQQLDVVAIDHDHKTGKIRGLLCNGCNKGLGLFKDDVIIIQKALNYLKIVI